jgi:hypothetical protein
MGPRSNPMGGAGLPSFGDAQIFFTAVLGLALVLLSGELLVQLVTHSNETAYGPALIARVASSPRTVRWIYVFFILLPVFLAVLAIGFPFFLRTLTAAMRNRLRRRELVGLAAMIAVIGVLCAEIWYGSSTNGRVALGAAALVGLWQAWSIIGERGGTLGFRVLAVAGLTFLGLAYYEQRHLAGADPSAAIAPTLLVAGFFLTVAGLLIATAAASKAGGRGRVLVSVCWLAVGYWSVSPLLRTLAKAGDQADDMELASTGAVGGLLLLAGLIREIGRRRELREVYYVAHGD